MIDNFDRPNGKFPDTFGNIIVLDSNYVVDLIIELLNGFITSLVEVSVDGLDPSVAQALGQTVLDGSLLADLTNININDYAFTIESVLANRNEVYSGTENE